MLRIIGLWMVCFPLWLTAQIAPSDISFNYLSTHPKAGNSLKLWSQKSAHAAFYQSPEGHLSLTGSFSGSAERIREVLQSFGQPFQIYQRVFTIELNIDDAISLLDYQNVLFLEAATRFNAPKQLDDKALEKSKVPQAQSLRMPELQGKDVVVGIVDVGFQTTHPTFYNETGSAYRVKRFWQQKYANRMGPAPYQYGILKNSESEILAAVDNDGAHGTHVAGIAAGSGFRSPALRYAGVAPKSDLVFVGIKYQNDSVGGSALGDYLVANNAIIDGFDYVFRYADSVGKPAVCNLSWGMHTGPHDGTSLFDLALEDLLNTPNPKTKVAQGRALVGACGNSAQHEMHIELNLDNQTKATLAMERSRNYYPTENVYCDFWSEKGSLIEYQIVLIDSQDRELIKTPFRNFSFDTSFAAALSSGSDTMDIFIASTKKYPHNEKSNVLMMVESNSQKRFIKINFKGTGIVHGWNSGRTYEWTAGTFRNYIRSYKPAHWVNGDAKYTLAENGGTSKAMLTAGSYNNRVNWLNFEGKFRSDSAVDEGEISGFSSWGPSVDGRLKPDIAAPGQFIASAYHKNAVPGWLSPYVVHKETWNNDDVYWVLLSGTSMAAPHAAGIVALLLEESKGKLKWSDMYEIIRSTSYRDAYTGADAGFQYGAGKIDAHAAILAVMNSVRTSQIEAAKKVIITHPEHLEILNMNPPKSQVCYGIHEMTGRIVFKGQSNSGLLPYPGLNQGIYVLTVAYDNVRFSQTVWLGK